MSDNQDRPGQISDEELRQRLSPEAYAVTRRAGTEAPFSGRYYDHHETGVYHCICCEAPLFSSEHKFDSGSGWPSYWQPVIEDAVTVVRDSSHGMIREEVRCARCDAHLGHVFPDGPPPTGQRHCINSLSLDFKAADK
ncbi:MAG: peptide-methionine (R)-S-oxide reductase MsrB [Thioalkalivibrio sp.]